MSRFLPCGILLAAACTTTRRDAAPVGPQEVITLAKPTAEFQEPFNLIRSVRELPDGRVLVLDIRDEVVSIADFETGSLTPVGRKGSGPGEYALPWRLIAIPNGETLIQDRANARYLVVDRNGVAGDPLALPEGDRAPLAAIGADQKGRLYFDAPLASRREGADSFPMMRWDPGSGRVDTVAWKTLRSSKIVSGGQAKGAAAGNAVDDYLVFGPVDRWFVAGDGLVGHLTSDPFVVTWYPEGRQPKSSRAVPYTPIPVTQLDKETFLGIDGTTDSTARAAALAGTRFAETKPPFEQDGVLVSPEGEVWILRSRAAADSIPVYDVFEKGGDVTRRVAIPPRTRVVGFGARTLYAVRIAADDLQHLRRYDR